MYKEEENCMGRQIRFYQLQEDALNFLDTFYKEGVVLYDYRANCLENYRQIDFTRYFQPNSTDVVGSYFLAYSLILQSHLLVAYSNLEEWL